MMTRRGQNIQGLQPSTRTGSPVFLGVNPALTRFLTGRTTSAAIQMGLNVHTVISRETCHRIVQSPTVEQLEELSPLPHPIAQPSSLPPNCPTQ